ncbi:hypothetical protein C9J85_18365 [Haloferax sp. wsp5]|nr:hypothetical protein C9J85_18365 [Haloferax sp. wsp5]
MTLTICRTIDQLTLLKSQFSSITIPRQVWDELTDGEAGVDTLRSLHDDEFLTITEVEQSHLFTDIFHELDLGVQLLFVMTSTRS